MHSIKIVYNGQGYATALTKVGFLKLRIFSTGKEKISKKAAALGHRTCYVYSFCF